MSKKKEDKSSDPGLGTVLGVGAAVVAGAALMYGAKKLFDFFDRPSEGAVGGVRAEPTTSQPVFYQERDKCHDSDSDEDYHENRRAQGWRPSELSPSGNGERVVSGARPKSYGFPPPPQSPNRSLSGEIHEYYHNYVLIRHDKISAARNIVDKITTMLASRLPTSVLRSVCGCVPVVQEVKEVGSALQVISCRDFDFHVIIGMKGRNLEKESTRSGKWRVIQTGEDLSEENGVILPSKLVDWLKQACTDVLVDIDIPVLIEVLRLDASLQLVVRFFDDSAMIDSKLLINLQPAILHDQVCLIPAYQLNPSTSPNDEQEWRECHSEQESRLLNRYGPSIDTHVVVLKVFKAIRINFPNEFGILSSYHYKTVLFRLLDDQPDENEWSDSVLSERFIDFLIELGSCCKEKLLPDYFEPDVNLLQNISPDSLQSLSQFVNKILGRNDFSCLFQERNYGIL